MLRLLSSRLDVSRTARRAAEQRTEEQALEAAMVAAAEATECEAEARAAPAGVWFRVEPCGAEHTR